MSQKLEKEHVHSYDVMDAAGWTYIKSINTAYCKTCGLKVSEWTKEMDPFAIHAKQSPNCSFIQSKNTSKLSSSHISTTDNQEKPLQHRKIDLNEENNLTELESLKNIRRRTFSHWHHERGITAAQMISAGFFNCNVGDRVICLYCNLICQQWISDTDDPEEVHCTLAPQCPYVRSMLKLRQTNAISIVNENYTDKNSNDQLQTTNNSRLNEIVHTSAYHKNYMEIPKRLASFTSWPEESLPLVDDFVRAGFFYTGTKTIVTCFYCNGSLQNWDSKDNPMVEHCRWFPTCAYAKQLCGDELGEAVVVNTGGSTILGQVGKMTRNTSGSEITGLHREINRFVLFVIAAALLSIIVLWITWTAWLNIKQNGYITFNGNIVNSIGMVVCFIPEGLPAAVTLVLTIVAKRMYKQKVMVKSLATVETFNSVSIVATDKTGTLTINQMTITALLWGTQGEYMIPIHTNNEPNATLNDEQHIIDRKRPSLTAENIPTAMKDLILGACLCNNVVKQSSLINGNGIDNPSLESNTNDTSLEKNEIVGDAADVALYHFCNDKCSVDIEQVKKTNPRINILPFNSKNKFMITANILEQTSTSIDNDATVLITLKGAPDFILSRCSTYKQDSSDEILPITEEFRSSIQQRQETLGKCGYRVIGMIQQKMKKSQYNSLIETYKTSKKQHQQKQSELISNEPDLNGLPGDNYCFIGNIVNSIGMIVTYIPEGLPAAVTLVLTIVAKRMYKQKVMVKSLATIEAFNCVSVIATDKTGTLTKSQMTITALLWGNEGEYMVPIHTEHEQNGTSEQEPPIIGRKRPSLSASDIASAMKDLILGACLCNNATKQSSLANSNSDSAGNSTLETNDNNISSPSIQLVGDAADVALYHLCNDKCSMDIEQVKKKNPRINTLPFNSKNKFMITANLLEQTSTNNDDNITVLVTLKGAPDFVLSRCSSYKPDYEDEMLPMTDEFRSFIQQRQETLGRSGYRVIAMLQQKMTKHQYDNLIETYKTSKSQPQHQQTVSDEPDLNGLPTNNYCFIGMFSLLDPARPEVPDAVLKARRAHIRIAMVTGDHPTTAAAIAKEVNIFSKQISIDGGTDTLKIERNTEIGHTQAHFMRNTNTCLETHIVSERTTSIQVKGIKRTSNLKMKSNIFKRILDWLDKTARNRSISSILGSIFCP
ncbi:unnamed protein product [Adineta steineri]|uniref:Uncharacterized protein n=1 Tax=Adineta steineri TaxID=433720 RepID=A0A814F020_9BILA|nr:unnamed protein product [Adineta steineri]